MTRRTRRRLSTRIALLAAGAVFGSLLVAGAAVGALTVRAVLAQSQALLDDVAASLSPGDGRPPATAAQVCAAVARGAQGGPPGVDALFVEVRRDGRTVCALDDGRVATGPVLRDLEQPDLPARVLLGMDLPTATGSDGRVRLVREVGLADGATALVARSADRDVAVLGRVRLAFVVVSVAGVLVALGLGLLVARRALRPVRQLPATADAIGRTGDLSRRVAAPDGPPDDEVVRLATAFDAMTTALAASRERQRRLVADAGHELRTPLTSLRTNVELLVRAETGGRALPADVRAALMSDLVAQLEELTGLAHELTVLADDDDGGPAVRAAVRLDDVVHRAVERVRRRAGARRLDVRAVPWVVPHADAAALERAVVNVLDNAVKFSPAASAVTVALAPDGAGRARLVVDGGGPGVPGTGRGNVFERFWRAEEARALPGSGLGLAITRDAVAAHGGGVRVEGAPGGGTRVVIDLPGAPPATR